MYREFVLLILSYFKTINKKEFVFDILIPLLFPVAFVILDILCVKLEYGNNFIKTSLTFISIILGFTVASITILLTSNSKNIKEVQKEDSKRQYGLNKLNLYQLLLIPFFYIALIGFIELILGAISVIFSLSNNVYVYAINIFLVLHILFVAIRNLTNLFFVVYKKVA